MLAKYRLEVTQIWRNTLNVGDTKFTSTSWVVRGNEGVAQMLFQTWPNSNSKWGLSSERLLKCCSKHDLRPRGKEKLAEEMSKVTQKMLKLKRGLRWQSRLFQTNLAVPEERRLLKCCSKHEFRTRLHVCQDVWCSWGEENWSNAVPNMGSEPDSMLAKCSSKHLMIQFPLIVSPVDEVVLFHAYNNDLLRDFFKHLKS